MLNAMKMSRLLKQTAVYWGEPVDDGYGGKSFTAGTEIDVRWEDKSVNFKNNQGEDTLSVSLIFVNQDLVIGGYLFLGGLDDLSSSASGDDPTLEHAAYEIKQKENIPNAKGSQFFKKVYL